jgi:hypothetical protein
LLPGNSGHNAIVPLPNDASYKNTITETNRNNVLNIQRSTINAPNSNFNIFTGENINIDTTKSVSNNVIAANGFNM